MATITIKLKDRKDNPFADASEEITVCIKNIRDNEVIQAKPIKEVGGGLYEASFTATRCGYYMISIIVAGCHIPGSPYKPYK